MVAGGAGGTVSACAGGGGWGATIWTLGGGSGGRLAAAGGGGCMQPASEANKGSVNSHAGALSVILRPICMAAPSMAGPAGIAVSIDGLPALAQSTQGDSPAGTIGAMIRPSQRH